MFKLRKDKKGFTLVEMILALAIICLLGTVIAGVCAQISSSFSTTYSIDDSADYAMLYARGFENSFLANTQGGGSAGKVWKWYVNDPKDGKSSVPTLRVITPDGVDSAVFEPKFIGNTTTSYKWSVRMFYKYDATNHVVKYRMFLKDNFSKTHYIYMYDGDFWIPRFEERAEYAGVKGSREILISGDSMTQATFKNIYKYTDDEVNTIKKYLDKEYRSTIEYHWG